MVFASIIVAALRLAIAETNSAIVLLQARASINVASSLGLKNNTEMGNFISHMVHADGKEVGSIDDFHGPTPWHSGVAATQTLSALRNDLHAKRWVGAITDEPVTVATCVDKDYVDMLPNFMKHMKTVLPMVQYSVYTMDHKTRKRCRELSLRFSSCVCEHRPMSEYESKYKARAKGNHYDSKVFQYKTDLFVELVRNVSSVLFLDITSLVLSKTCWHEFTQYPEDIVGSPAFGLPAKFTKKYGVAMNTGAILLRRTALPLLEQFERLHFEKGGPQQPALMKTFDVFGFNWTEQDDVANVSSTNTSVRFLSYPTWGRDEQKCLYHPSKCHESHEETFRRAGLWYL